MKTIIATAHLEGGERLAGRAALAADPEGALHFWLGQLDARLAESTTGFVVGDSLSVADLRVFCELTAATSGWYDGVGLHDNASDFWRPYPAIVAHRRKIAALPPIRQYYSLPENQDPIRAYFAAAGVEGVALLEQVTEAVSEVARL
jgi:glutathione S-transferase